VRRNSGSTVDRIGACRSNKTRDAAIPLATLTTSSLRSNWWSSQHSRTSYCKPSDTLGPLSNARVRWEHVLDQVRCAAHPVSQDVASLIGHKEQIRLENQPSRCVEDDIQGRQPDVAEQSAANVGGQRHEEVADGGLVLRKRRVRNTGTPKISSVGCFVSGF
jgi:hypothetical protein